MIGFAVLFGLLAVFIAQSWLNSQAELRMRSLEAQKKTDRDTDDRGRGKPLRFGAELGSTSLREIEWPEGAIPNGAFSKISDITSRGRRVVLTAIEANEPILASKITGPGQRATLSAVVARRHAGGHHSRQRRRRRRRLRAAGRPRRHRAHAPERQDRRHHRRGAAEHQACWRSNRSPTSAPTSRRSRARSPWRSTRQRHRSSRSPRRSEPCR